MVAMARHKNRGPSLLATLWAGWLLVFGCYVLPTLALSGTEGEVLVCEHSEGDSHYGESSVRLVPFGIECTWYFDALGEESIDPTAPGTRVERALAFPVLTPAMNVALIVGLLWLVAASRRAHDRDRARYEVSVYRPDASSK
jgi:hypothetical protein